MYGNVVPTAALLAILADAIASSFHLTLLTLFTNDVDPGPGAVVGDFTAATFVNGATPAAVTWSTPFINNTPQATIIGGVSAFAWVSGATEVVYGYYLTANAGHDFLGYARLVTPKPMSAVTDAIDLVPRLSMPAAGYGSSVDLSE